MEKEGGDGERMVAVPVLRLDEAIALTVGELMLLCGRGTFGGVGAM